MRFDEGDVRLRGFGLDHHRLEFRFEFRGVELLFQVIRRNIQAFDNLRKALFEELGIIAKSRMLKEG